jgi:YD repeat-containing protein
VRVESTTAVDREVGGAQDGVILRTIDEDPEYDATYGFVTSSTRTVTTGTAGDEWETTTAFDRGAIDTASTYCLGLPGLVETTRTLPGGTLSATRRAEYEFNSDCSLGTLTDLSDATDETKQLVREFAYDGFGNVVSVKEYSVDGPSLARETTFGFNADDPQFAESVTVEGVDLATLLEFDPLLGARTSVTGPDAVTASFDYDVFGRLTQEQRPAGSTDFTCGVRIVNQAGIGS